MLLDADGEVYSLRRQIAGVTAKDLRALMDDMPLATLPSVAEGRAAVGEARRAAPEPVAPQEPHQAPPDDRTAALRQKIEAMHRADLAEQERRHAGEVTELHDRQQAQADQAFDAFAREQARRTLIERPEEAGTFERLWRTIRESIFDEARVQRLAEETRRAAEADERRNDEVRIMVAGVEASQRAEIDRLVERHGRERADLLQEQERDMARRIADDERARALAREYEQRRQEGVTPSRMGFMRAPRLAATFACEARILARTRRNRA